MNEVSGYIFRSPDRASLPHDDIIIKKYTFGSVILRNGITIGLVFNKYPMELLQNVSDKLLPSILGATI